MGKYSGTGDKADLVNHTNQMNPEHEAYESSRSDDEEEED